MENQEIIKETIDTARSLTSINITMQLLSWDVFWGSLLAIPTGLMPFTQSDWALSFSITSHERSVLPSLTKITSNENPLAFITRSIQA